MIGFMPCESKKEEFQRYELKDGVDMAVFGDGVIFPARMEGFSGNTLVIGPTRSGKSTSVLLPCIMRSFNQSLVIPIVKRKMFDLCAPLLRSRGYNVIDLNLASAKDSPYGYDPMTFVKTDQDYMALAESITGGSSKTFQGDSDPYWSISCQQTLSALAQLSRYIYGKTAGFAEFLDLYKSLEVTYPNGHCRTNLVSDFDDMEYNLPDSLAPRLWRTLEGNSSKTAACILSITNAALSKYSGEWASHIFKKKKMFNPVTLGQKKTALFITTSSTVPSGKHLMNLLFGDMIKALFEDAEKRGGELAVPVSIYFDDFAAGARIVNFADYISTFCAAGISATILIQSKSQLTSLYSEFESSTIISNCENIVYLGGNEISIAREMAERTGRSLQDILSMKPGEEIFIRRGEGARFVKRYDTFSDPVYLSMLEGLEK